VGGTSGDGGTTKMRRGWLRWRDGGAMKVRRGWLRWRDGGSTKVRRGRDGGEPRAATAATAGQRCRRWLWRGVRVRAEQRSGGAQDQEREEERGKESGPRRSVGEKNEIHSSNH
jgi:hypothetical protein